MSDTGDRLDALEKAVRSKLDVSTLPADYNLDKAIQGMRITLTLRQTKLDNGNYAPMIQGYSPGKFVAPAVKMAHLGLNSLLEQCYFVPNHGNIDLVTSYLGKKSIILRSPRVRDFWARVIFKGDTFTFAHEDGEMRVIEHEQNVANREPSSGDRAAHIRGAYGILEWTDGSKRTYLLGKSEILDRWEMGQNRHSDDLSQTQTRHPNNSAMKTAMSSVAKYYMRTLPDIRLDGSGEPVDVAADPDLTARDQEREEAGESMKKEPVSLDEPEQQPTEKDQDQGQDPEPDQSSNPPAESDGGQDASSDSSGPDEPEGKSGQSPGKRRDLSDDEIPF